MLRHRGEPGTLPHLLGEPLGEPPHFVLLLRVVDGEKDLGDAALRFVRGFLCALQRVIDLLVGHHIGLRHQSAHQLCPDDRCGQLIDQRAALDAVRLQDLVELPGLHVVLLFDLREGLVDLLVGSRDVLPFGFLHLQFLVDDRAQHLGGDALPCFGRVRQV